MEILRKCADAMEYGARLWVIEQVVDDDLASSLGVALLDLNMLICFRRASRKRIRPPAPGTGFANVTVLETGTAWRVIEGRSD